MPTHYIYSLSGIRPYGPLARRAYPGHLQHLMLCHDGRHPSVTTTSATHHQALQLPPRKLWNPRGYSSHWIPRSSSNISSTRSWTWAPSWSRSWTPRVAFRQSQTRTRRPSFTWWSSLDLLPWHARGGLRGDLAGFVGRGSLVSFCFRKDCCDRGLSTSCLSFFFLPPVFSAVVLNKFIIRFGFGAKAGLFALYITLAPNAQFCNLNWTCYFHSFF